MKMIIITDRRIYPPIPERKNDWEAITEDCGDGYSLGYARTEKEAIIDLLNQEEELNNK